MRAGLAAAPLRNQLRHRKRRLITLRTQPCDDALAIGDGPVLAYLPLALDSRDRNLDADDRPDLHGDEILRGVFDMPGRRAAILLRARQLADLLAQPAGIFDRARAAPRMYRGIIPGWHDLAGLALRRIPGRRDIFLRALKNDKALLDRR